MNTNPHYNFIELMDTLSNQFLKQIKDQCREGFDYDKKYHTDPSSGFAMFDLANDLYYKSKYQRDYLEWKIRDILVNEAFDYLFRIHNYDIRWRMSNTCLTTDGYTNVANESKFPVEFFIVKNGKYIAYRYTPFTADYSIPYNLPQDFKLMYHQTGVSNVDKWYFIDWSASSDDDFSTEDSFQATISPKCLFLEYFSVEEYKIFISKIKYSVEQANKILGFQSIPRLVSNKLSVFKQKVLADLQQINFQSMDYILIDDYNQLTQIPFGDIFTQADAKRIHDYFFGDSRYLALIGTEKFAQSFLTAEYLYSIFKEDAAFDYTSVVSGYIKAVEQLCNKIINDYIVPQYDSRLYYLARRLKPKESSQLKNASALMHVEKFIYVQMDETYKDYFYKDELTMGQLFYFLLVNANYILHVCPIANTKNKNKSKMFECLKNYYDYSRNGYFHKDNISDFQVVKRIRNNSLLIIYWLLGSIIFSSDIHAKNTLLGIVDDSFDRLYKKIAYANNYRYIIKFHDQQEQKVIRIPNPVTDQFDDNGFLLDAEIKFIEVDAYPKNYSEYRNAIDNLPDTSKFITINQKQIPEELFSISPTGEKNKITF